MRAVACLALLLLSGCAWSLVDDGRIREESVRRNRDAHRGRARRPAPRAGRRPGGGEGRHVRAAARKHAARAHARGDRALPVAPGGGGSLAAGAGSDRGDASRSRATRSPASTCPRAGSSTSSMASASRSRCDSCPRCCAGTCCASWCFRTSSCICSSIATCRRCSILCAGWSRTTQPPPCRPRSKATPRATAMPLLAGPTGSLPDPEQLRDALEAEAQAQTKGALAEAPALLRLTLTLPYARGYPLSLAEGTELLEDPPATTEQVIARRAPARGLRGRGSRAARGGVAARLRRASARTRSASWASGCCCRISAAPRSRPPPAMAGTATATWRRAAANVSRSCGGRRGTRSRTRSSSPTPTRGIAPAVQARAGLAAPPRAVRDGTRVLIASEPLAPLLPLLGERARRARIHTLDSLRAHFGLAAGTALSRSRCRKRWMGGEIAKVLGVSFDCEPRARLRQLRSARDSPAPRPCIGRSAADLDRKPRARDGWAARPRRAVSR